MSGFTTEIDIQNLKYCNQEDDIESCLDYDTVKTLLNTINQLINTFNIDTKNIIQNIDNYHKDVVTNKELFDLKSKIDQKYNNIIILNDLITLKKKFEEKLEEKIPTSSYPKKTREYLEKLKKDATELNIKDDEYKELDDLYKELDALYNDLIKDFEKYDNTYVFKERDKMYFQTIETKLGKYESKLNDIKYCNIEFGGKKKKGRKTNKRTTKKMKKSKKVKSKTKKVKKMKKINRNKQSKKIKTGGGGCMSMMGDDIPQAKYVDNIKTAEAKEVNSQALKKLRDLGLLKPTTATYVDDITVAVDSIVLEQKK